MWEGMQGRDGEQDGERVRAVVDFSYNFVLETLSAEMGVDEGYFAVCP